MSVISRPPVAIKVGNDVVYSGTVNLSSPGATLDPETGDLVLPSGSSGLIYSKTINATDVSNKYFLLPQSVGNKEATQLIIDGIPPLIYNIHYKIDDTDASKLIWLAMGLDGFIEINDKVLVTYFI